MRLLKKELDLEGCETLYHRAFSEQMLREDFEVRAGRWWVEDGWLVGQNRDNFAAMIISKADYFGNVMLDFKACTVLPCTHDINVMWNGGWNEQTNTRDIAYVAGLQGWWHGKVGIEKSPEYKLNAANPLFAFTPGQVYHVQTGSIDGHVFVIIDGVLVLELTDPDPIDNTKYGRVGFEAYCSYLKFTDFSIKRVAYREVEETYQPEF